jgi:hypothetical protein
MLILQLGHQYLVALQSGSLKYSYVMARCYLTSAEFGASTETLLHRTFSSLQDDTVLMESVMSANPKTSSLFPHGRRMPRDLVEHDNTDHFGRVQKI